VAPQRADRARALRDRADLAATLLGLALLLDCARAARLPPPGLAALGNAPSGKPVWPGGPDFSISHAAGRCACALAPPGLAVGLDIEARDAVSARALRLVAAERELAVHAEAGLSAVDLWVAKEAVAKAAGRGLDVVSRVRAGVGEATLDGRRFSILRPSIAPGVAAAVAVPRRCEIVLRERDGRSLLEAGP